MRLMIKKWVIFSGFVWFAGVFFVLVGCQKNTRSQMTKEMTKNFTNEKDEVQNLKIDAGNLDVEVHQGDDFRVFVRYVQGGRPTIRLKEATLSIFSSNYSVVIKKNEKLPKIKLTVPKGKKFNRLELKGENLSVLAKDVQVTTAMLQLKNGDVELSNFYGKKLKITDKNGDLILKNVSVESLDLNQENGDIDINQLKTIKKSELNNINGETWLSKLAVPGLDLETENAELTVHGKKYVSAKYKKGDKKKALRVRADNGEIVVK